MKTYQEIVTNDKYSSIRWIANVIFTSCGKRAARLKALVALIDNGHDVGSLDFVMPYEGLRIDGNAVVTIPLLDRGESIPYGNDWYKH